MSLSNSRMSYLDCFDLLDKALDEPRGIRVELADEELGGLRPIIRGIGAETGIEITVERIDYR